MKLVFLILYLFLITPVKLGVLVSAGGGPPEAAVGVMIWGFRAVARVHLRRVEGTPRLCASFRGRSVTIRPGQSRRGWSAKALRMLARTVIRKGKRRPGLWLRTLDGVILIGGQDAARVALLAGGVRAALSWPPLAGIRCQPAFGGQTALRIRCIAQARLGTIGAAGLGAMLAKRRANRKEEGAWIIPSGN